MDRRYKRYIISNTDLTLVLCDTFIIFMHLSISIFCFNIWKDIPRHLEDCSPSRIVINPSPLVTMVLNKI